MWYNTNKTGGAYMVLIAFICIVIILVAFILLLIGDFQYSQSSKGKKENMRHHQKQKQIEKEFGLIEYWEDK